MEQISDGHHGDTDMTQIYDSNMEVIPCYTHDADLR